MWLLMPHACHKLKTKGEKKKHFGNKAIRGGVNITSNEKFNIKKNVIMYNEHVVEN